MVVGVVESEIIENIVLRANCIGVISTCRTVIPGKCDHTPPETKEKFHYAGISIQIILKGATNVEILVKGNFC